MTRLLPLALLLPACLEDGGDDGALDLSPGFGEAQVSGTSEGTEQLDTCAGLWPETAQHQLTLDGTFTDLGVLADSTDVAIMITRDASTWCSDETDGLPAVVRGSWSAGTYDVFVGVPDGGSAGSAYELSVVEHYYDQ